MLVAPSAHRLGCDRLPDELLCHLRPRPGAHRPQPLRRHRHHRRLRGRPDPRGLPVGDAAPYAPRGCPGGARALEPHLDSGRAPRRHGGHLHHHHQRHRHRLDHRRGAPLDLDPSGRGDAVLPRGRQHERESLLPRRVRAAHHRGRLYDGAGGRDHPPTQRRHQPRDRGPVADLTVRLCGVRRGGRLDAGHGDRHGLRGEGIPNRRLLGRHQPPLPGVAPAPQRARRGPRLDARLLDLDPRRLLRLRYHPGPLGADHRLDQHDGPLVPPRVVGGRRLHGRPGRWHPRPLGRLEQRLEPHRPARAADLHPARLSGRRLHGSRHPGARRGGRYLHAPLVVAVRLDQRLLDGLPLAPAGLALRR